LAGAFLTGSKEKKPRLYASLNDICRFARHHATNVQVAAVVNNTAVETKKVSHVRKINLKLLYVAPRRYFGGIALQTN
jgi:hypothetical protein